MSVLSFLFISTILIYFLFLQIREYNQLVFTRYRFRYFALRDELALLVMRGRINEDSWEYQRIVEAINFHISAVETLSIIRLVNLLIAYHTSPNEKQQFELLARRIEDPDIVRIMVQYMDTTYDLLRRNSRAQLRCIRMAKWVLALVGSDARPKHELVVNPSEALTAIESYKSAFRAAATPSLDGCLV